MSNRSQQRVIPREIRNRASDAGAGDSLAESRAEVDRLFAVASKSFAAMTEGNSREFLRRSRQTGGQ